MPSADWSRGLFVAVDVDETTQRVQQSLPKSRAWRTGENRFPASCSLVPEKLSQNQGETLEFTRLPSVGGPPLGTGGGVQMSGFYAGRLLHSSCCLQWGPGGLHPRIRAQITQMAPRLMTVGWRLEPPLTSAASTECINSPCLWRGWGGGVWSGFGQGWFETKPGHLSVPRGCAVPGLSRLEMTFRQMEAPMEGLSGKGVGSPHPLFLEGCG